MKTISMIAMVSLSVLADADLRGASTEAPILGSTRFDGELLGSASAPTEPLALWYRQPAGEWLEAVAIGNGRLGGMVFGGIDLERIQLNEDTFWSGGPYDPTHAEALQYLPEARRLTFAGHYEEAARLIDAKLLAKPKGQLSYQPVGDLMIEFAGGDRVVHEYRRELNLDTAIATVTFKRGGVRYTREVFVSPVDQVMVVRLTADRSGQISFNTRLATPQNATVTGEGEDTLVLRGIGPDYRGIKGALKFECRVRVLPQGGKLTLQGGALSLSGADSALLLLDAATSYRNWQDISGDPGAITRAHLEAAARVSFKKLKAQHVAEHQRLFRRVKLDLGGRSAECAQQPTDERVKAYAKGAADPQLEALYFQFGRYLLISSSRPGDQPANLQGIWNQDVNPAWDSKYTMNINTEMNYWPAETCNLSECAEPLIQMVKDISHTGARTAQVMFKPGAGFASITPTCGAPRRSSTATGPSLPTCGAWLTPHLWEHYQFTGDKKFLAEVYPVFKGAAEFFLDFLVEEPTHKWLVTCPSASPENGHPPGLISTSAGPTMDNQILRDTFNQCIRAAEILGRDRTLPPNWPRRATACRPTRLAKRASFRNGLRIGTWRRRHSSPPRLAFIRFVPQRADHPPRHARAGSGGAQVVRDARRRRHRLGPGLAAKPLGAAAGCRACPHHSASLIAPDRTLPTCSIASALPDRRQFRRHGGHCGDALAESGTGDARRERRVARPGLASRVAQGLAGRVCHRLEGSGRVRSGPRLEGRRAGASQNSQPPGHALRGSLRRKNRGSKSQIRQGCPPGRESPLNAP